jgi:hypothetical protein
MIPVSDRDPKMMAAFILYLAENYHAWAREGKGEQELRR